MPPFNVTGFLGLKRNRVNYEIEFEAVASETYAVGRINFTEGNFVCTISMASFQP
jgi:hypothetical protein